MSTPGEVNPNRKVRVTAKIDFQLQLLFRLACKEMGVSRACYELPAAASTRAAAGNMSTANTRKCNPPSTSGNRS